MASMSTAPGIVAQPASLPEALLQLNAAHAQIVALQAELDLAHRDPIWGVYTRVGLERRMPHPDSGMGCVVLDVDQMRLCNDRYGHAGLDERMTQALLSVRDGDAISGRWEEGDEVVIFAPIADLAGLAERLQHALWQNGLSATMAIVHDCTVTAIIAGQTRVEEAKRADERGHIFVVEEVYA